MKHLIASLILAVAATAPAFAQVSLNTYGQVYSQDFNGLPSSGPATTITTTTGAQGDLTGVLGWQATRIGGTSTSAMNLIVDTGASNTGGVFSYGATTSTDRALGSLASGTNIPGFGASFVNNTGVAISSIAISLTAEFWRSSTVQQNTLTFGYGLLGGNATSANYLTTSSASALSTMNIVGPDPVSGTNGALDGTSPANQALVSATLSGLGWAPGQTLYIRWQDQDNTGSDAGLAIDDLTLVAIPESSTYAILVGAAALGFAITRRKQRKQAA